MTVSPRLLTHLARVGLPLPADTHSGNLARRLHAAALTKAACHTRDKTRKRRPRQPADDSPWAGGMFMSLSGKGEGKWVTIGGHKGEDGKRHGGSPVYIEGGRITKGHPGLTGKRIDALKEEGEHGSHRKQLAQGREHGRAVWAKKARQEGIEPKHLHSLAGAMLAHDKEYTEDRKRMLQRARSLSKGLDYGNIDNLKARNASGTLDASSLKGLDDVAERVGEEFPHLFSGRGHKADQLFDLLAAGNPTPMSEDEAYEQAHGHLAEEARRQREEAEQARMQPGEEVPF